MNSKNQPSPMFDSTTFTAAQLAGQRLMIGFDGLEMNDRLAYIIESLKVAGIILFARNIETPKQVEKLCADAQSCAKACGQPPLLIAIDQEGGQVARLPEPFTQFPGNPAMKDEKDAVRFAEITAGEISDIGVNMNYAPVLDIAPSDMDSIMAGRAFGADPEWVAKLGAAVIDTLQKNGVMAVAKHFPGIGRTVLDSHLDLPYLNAPLSLLENSDLLPFKAAIENGVAGVMLSHILYSEIDPEWPASISTAIARDLLRNTMGYTGVVMTDDLDMGAVKGRWNIPTLMERLEKAHIDLALICHEGPDIDAAAEAMKILAETSEDSIREAIGSAGRVLALKAAYIG